MAIDLEQIKDDVTAILKPDYVTVTVKTLSKNLSWPTFLTLLLPYLGRSAGEFDTIMPENLCYISKTTDKMFISVYLPEHIRHVTYDTRSSSPKDKIRKFVIPLPNIVAEYSLVKSTDSWVVNSANFFMTKQSRLQTSLWYRAGMRIHRSLGDNLRNYCVVSLPNIYDGGNMCIGENSMPNSITDNDLSGLDTYISVLLDQPFSRDLSIRSVTRSVFQVAERWLEELHEKPEFPYSLTYLGGE